MRDQHWTAYASCSGCADDLFVEGAARQRTAREVCAACPVRLECLVDALDHAISFGVWGGLTERERRALTRRFPGVTSWEEVVAGMSLDELVDAAHPPRSTESLPAPAAALPRSRLRERGPRPAASRAASR